MAENLAAHNLDEDIEFPKFAVAPPQFTSGARFPAALYHDLEQGALAYSQTWVEPDPVESHVPLLTWLKQTFHRLVVYYVNLLGERQMIVNATLLRALNQIVTTLDRPNAEIVVLRHEVSELRARLEQLEKNGDNG